MDFYPKLDEPEGTFQFQFSALPDLWRKFNIPRLPDKPQDPILDTLRFHQQRLQNQKGSFEPDSILPPLPRLNLNDDDCISPSNETRDVWAAAMKPANHRCHQNEIMSWEALWLPKQSSQSPFLSESASHALSAALHCFSPKFHDSATHVVNVSVGELVRCLQNVLTGTTTSLYAWNAEKQLLLPNASGRNEAVQLSISGLDDTIGQSIVQRFLSIGTLARRLDILVSDMRNLATGKRPDLHSFTHALESISAEVKRRIFHFTWSTPDDFEALDVHTLTILWRSCSDYEDLLNNLLSLCRRDMTVQPADYSLPFSNASDLLTVLYNRLEIHIEGNSPRMITGMFAFLLSSISSDYFERLSPSVGYSRRALSAAKPPSSRRAAGLLDDDVQDGDETIEEVSLDETFPSFFGARFSKAIIRARQSLVLLRAAQPDHPLLNSYITRPKVRWLWSEEEVGLVWNQSLPPESPISAGATAGDSTMPRPQSEGAFSCLRTFDMEPGAHLLGRPAANTDFGNFISTFPERLPSLTPTLQSLKDLILEPLEAHINSLSAALVDIFISSNEYLNFHHHLVLLRSYVLLTSHAFKLRLQSALFSGMPENHGAAKDARSIAVQARASKNSKKAAERSRPNWVIGLAPSLTEGNTWPPGGSDLGWHLRAVILDSLAADFPDKLTEDDQPAKEDSGSAQVVREAEWRLGFAIRDLSTASGRAKWLDPKSMEALDFLYMDYHPPHPLDVLIPSSTLSKYHRLFAFNLRLMRVQNVLEALFRMTTRSDPLFETLTPSHKRFLHFRFLAHTVVTTISSYVYDTAIGGHFDAFLSTLSPSTPPTTTPSSPLHSSTASMPSQRVPPVTEEPQSHLSDVFALAERHSKVLDDILGACLLRSSQKVAGEILRGILDTVLKFGILMSDLAARRVQEYEAAAPLEDLYQLFRRRCIALVKALKTLLDASSSGTDIDDVQLQMMSGSLTGVAASLHNLLIRLDVSEWWDRQRPRP